MWLQQNSFAHQNTLQAVVAGRAGKGSYVVGSGRILYYPGLALPECIKSRNYRVFQKELYNFESV
jgi:hypothetical protein